MALGWTLPRRNTRSRGGTGPAHVFILCTGRCGSTTFIRAAAHITNYTSGHETRCHLVGDAHFAYPARHIEADNRLSWFLGRLDHAFGDNAHYVHLRRDRLQTAKSFLKRHDRGIMKAYSDAILMNSARLSKDTAKLDICLDYVDTVTANIDHFLRDKTNVMDCRMERGGSDFAAFWDWIGADGDRSAALAEWTVRHNASD